jgi:cation:H+ antiporter
MAGLAVMWIVLLIVGFALLVKGADFFVDGAAGIAEKLKVSSFIIGLTIVAIGTSAPEAAVSVIGAATGNGDVIVGNIVGSNIMNILLILGISALITKIPVESSSRKVELPFLFAITILFVGFGLWGQSFTWWEGLILLALYGAFMAYTILTAKRQRAALLEGAAALSDTAVEVEAETISATQTATGFKGALAKVSAWYERMKEKVWFLIVITIVGLGMVVGGAELVVNAASFIAADLLGIPQIVVGLTVVAFGTSLPELVTSITAAKRGDMGLATGNIIGSNIANLLFVGGLGFLCSGANSIAVSGTSFLIDGLVSLAAALMLWGFSFTKKRSLGKVAGFIMLASLIIYYVYLFLTAYNVIVLPSIF